MKRGFQKQGAKLSFSPLIGRVYDFVHNTVDERQKKSASLQPCLPEDVISASSMKRVPRKTIPAKSAFHRSFAIRDAIAG